jgi:aryl-alcohol dehydrogenase-like predicted oxidoreductase
MEQRLIGSLLVSVIGLGCDNFGVSVDQAGAMNIVRTAIGSGVNFFDTADTYGSRYGLSEEYLGRAVQGSRDDVVIATKFGNNTKGARGGASPAYIREALQGSLLRLRTDRVDLYQLHKPDPSVPISETIGCLAELVDEGLIVEFGLSNVSGEALHIARQDGDRSLSHRVASVQNRLNMLETLDRTDGLVACQDLGLAYLPYLPLASGVLTGKYRSCTQLPAGSRLAEFPQFGTALTSDNLKLVDAWATWALERGRTVGELAHAWLLAHHPVASVLSGATSSSQVTANAAAADWVLSPSS